MWAEKRVKNSYVLCKPDVNARHVSALDDIVAQEKVVMWEYGQATQEYLQVHTKQTNSNTEGSKKDITGRVFILTET